MKTIDFKELYKPYSEKASLEETVSWLLRECRNLGINEDSVNEVIKNTFVEISEGKTFSIEGAGKRGFEGIPHADLNLYMKDMAIKIHNNSMTVYIQEIEDKLRPQINVQLRKNKRRRYIEYLKRESPIVRMFIKKEQDGT